ncbi:MAG: response regulator transcription factor [Bacillota bacterium]
MLQVVSKLALNQAAHPLQVLGPREREVFDLVIQGLDNHEISKRLFLSDKTVKNYVTSLRKKLGLKNRAQIVLFAVAHGMLEVVDQ